MICCWISLLSVGQRSVSNCSCGSRGRHRHLRAKNRTAADPLAGSLHRCYVASFRLQFNSSTFCSPMIPAGRQRRLSLFGLRLGFRFSFNLHASRRLPTARPADDPLVPPPATSSAALDLANDSQIKATAVSAAFA